MNEIHATSTNGMAVVYGNHSGRFIQLQHPLYGKDYNDFVFFSATERGIEISDTSLALPRGSGYDWFFDIVERVLEEYGIPQDIHEQIMDALS